LLHQILQSPKRALDPARSRDRTDNDRSAIELEYWQIKRNRLSRPAL
jgi:hypothetical protein